MKWKEGLADVISEVNIIVRFSIYDLKVNLFATQLTGFLHIITVLTCDFKSVEITILAVGLFPRESRNLYG